MRALWGAAFAGLLTVVCPLSAFAQTAAPSGVGGEGGPEVPAREDTLETTYTLGMGSGSRAGATAISALALNNSNMGAIPTYQVEAFSQIIPSRNGGTYWTIGSSVSDSTTAKRISLGTSFRAIFGKNPERQYAGWDWRSAIGIQAIPQLGLGLGFRWARIDADRQDGQRLGPNLRAVTLDASLTITPIPWLRVSGLGYNLIKTNSALAPQMAGGSVSVAPIETLSFGGDILVDLSTFEKSELLLGAGLQFVAAQMVPLRIGYRRDNGRDLNQITVAAGFNKGKFGTEVALRQDIASTVKESYILIMARFVVK